MVDIFGFVVIDLMERMEEVFKIVFEWVEVFVIKFDEG